MIKIISTILSVVAFLAAIWIIVPSPAYSLWLFSVAASEWSLWIGVIALLAVIFSTFPARRAKGGKIRVISLLFAVSALIISLYPLSSILPLARETGVTPSISRYFSRFGTNDDSLDKMFSTQTFAVVEGENLQFDVYDARIKNENNGAAVVVIHGGSWNAGNRNDFPQWNKWLAENGFTVFDIDYRLAPQPNYLTATSDIKYFILWLKEHAAEFNISPDRITLFGRSAGAHLALLAAYSAGDSNLPSTRPAKVSDEKVRAVISFYAPVELLWAYDHPANEMVINGPQKLADFIGGSPHENDEMQARYILASPTAHVSAETPPTMLVHGGHDQLVRTDNMTFAADKLEEFGVEHKLIYIPYAQHGFDYNFHGWGSQITKPLMLDFLRENTKVR